MRKLATLAFAALLGTSTAAMAQDNLVTVNLGGISADLASELGIDYTELPSSIRLSAELAAEVCGIEVGSLTDSCDATTVTTDLVAEVDDELDGPGNRNNNSAARFAPGQQDGHAKDFAPGQQDGNARDHAPGQLKKNDSNN